MSGLSKSLHAQDEGKAGKTMSDYENQKQNIAEVPKFALGQEVQTQDGVGIIVKLEMPSNGLHLSPERAAAVVWYSTGSSVKRVSGGKWGQFTYRLSELQAV
jgi:hypothetical protein